MITVSCSEGSERELEGPAVSELTTGQDLEPDSVNPEAELSLDSEFAIQFSCNLYYHEQSTFNTSN